MKKQTYTNTLFIVILLFFLYYFYAIARPFLGVFVWAAIAAVTLNPVNRKFRVWFRGRKSLSAFCTLMVFLGGLFAPLMVLVSIIARQAAWVVDKLSTGGIPPELTNFWLHPQTVKIRQLLSITDEALAEAGKKVFRFLAEQSSVLVGTILESLVHFAFMLIVLYYFFKFGEDIVAWFRRILPFKAEQEKRFLTHMSNVVRGTMMGMLVTVLLQGFLAGIGFWILGFPSPLVWAVLTAFAALVPAVGAALIWAPTAVYLFCAGQLTAGIVMALWGIVVLGVVDNVVKPLIIQGKVRLHSAIILFSIMGGIPVFGVAGFVLGPLVVSVAIALLEEVQTIVAVADRKEKTSDAGQEAPGTEAPAAP